MRLSNRHARLFCLCLVVTGITVLVAVPGASGDEPAYVGNKNCKKCHIKEWRSWGETPMGNAFETLKPGVKADEKKAAGLDPDKDYTTDASCLQCHTTGYGKPGGFVDVASTPELTHVGCEVCHGPGSIYTQDQHMSLKNKTYKRADLIPLGLTDKITKELCASCHNSDNPTVGDDYVFDFEEYEEKGTHEKFPMKHEH